MDRILSCLLVVGVFLFLAISISKNRNHSGSITTRVENQIVAYDAETGAYLVDAKNIRAIEGVNKHVSGNLPANIWYYADDLYVVDPNHRFDSPNEDSDNVRNRKINWQPVDRGYQIMPRGEAVEHNFILDQLDGYEYNYIQEKGKPPE